MRKKFIRSHTQIYARGWLGIRRLRCKHAVIRRCTLPYAEAKNSFAHVQNISAYVSVWNIRYAFAYHTLGVSWIRYFGAKDTLLIRRIRLFLRIFIRQSLVRYTFNTLHIRRHFVAMTLLRRYFGASFTCRLDVTVREVYLAYV